MTLDSCLIDSNILLRVVLRGSPDHSLVRAAFTKLISSETPLYFTHQNIAEFWNVATRPVEMNGFGLSVADAEREVSLIERGMRLLPDSAAVYHEWRRIVSRHEVRGMQVHDARIAAAMIVHGITYILTLNGRHFTRFQGITAVHPEDI
jgi:predicted nucleic acid-binding protein